MTIIGVLHHQWRRQWRSATWGRNLVATVLLVLAAVYVGILFVGLGWFYPQVVAEVAPDRDPLRLLNASLLYGAVGLIVGRFFLQRSAGSDVRAYRPLPIRDGQLVRLLQVTSALSLFNLLPVVLLATLWGSTVWPAAAPTGAVLWAVGALLAVALTQFANTLLLATGLGGLGSSQFHFGRGGLGRYCTATATPWRRASGRRNSRTAPIPRPTTPDRPRPR